MSAQWWASYRITSNSSGSKRFRGVVRDGTGVVVDECEHQHLSARSRRSEFESAQQCGGVLLSKWNAEQGIEAAK